MSLFLEIISGAADIFDYAEKPVKNFFNKPTTDKIAIIAPKLIAFIGACVVDPSYSFFAIVIIVGVNKTAPKLVAHQIVRDVLYGVGAAIITTEILLPFARIVTVATVGTSLIVAGYFYPQAKGSSEAKGQDAPTAPRSK